MERDAQIGLADRTPYFHHLGMELVEVREGFARLQVAYEEHLTHPFGYLHGGVIAGLADSAGFNAVLTLLGETERAATLEMKINFLQPTRGEVIEAEGRVVHRGKRTAVSDVVVNNKAGKIIAKAIVTCAIY
jgi:uncharacterized protein (TIGR00369 family)